MRGELKGEIAELGHVGLATVLVGDDPASEIYIRLKHKAAEEVGIEPIDHRLPATTTEDELVELVAESERERRRRRDPRPDAVARADRRSARDAGDRSDEGRRRPASVQRRPALPRPPDARSRDTARCHAPPRRVPHPDRRARAVVVGRSTLVGKPMAMLLLQANATVTICHSRTEDLARHTLDADVLVAAVGLPGVITADMVKQGATVDRRRHHAYGRRAGGGRRGRTSPRSQPSSRRFRAASAR